jgi:hypothetical protein
MHRVVASCACLTVLVVGLTGCGPGQGPADAFVPPIDAACSVGGGAPPWLILGTGSSSLVELPAGADLELVHGPQGGWHLEATAVFGLAVSPDMHVLRYDVTRTDGTVLGTTQIALLERRLTRACGGWFRGGDILVLTITGPADVVGSEVDITVSVLDAGGEVVRDARRVRVVDVLP